MCIVNMLDCEQEMCDGQCVENMCMPGFCDPDTCDGMCVDNNCAPVVVPDDFCEVDDPYSCDSGMCIDNVCIPCSAENCPNGECIEGMCLLNTGESCENDDMCNIMDLCVDGSCMSMMMGGGENGSGSGSGDENGSGSGSGDDETFDNCECLDSTGIPLNAKGKISVTDSTCTVHNYRPNYGAGMCDKWDKNLGPYCNVAETPDFCEKKWCYVSKACTAGDVTDTAFFGIDLKFSY